MKRLVSAVKRARAAIAAVVAASATLAAGSAHAALATAKSIGLETGIIGVNTAGSETGLYEVAAFVETYRTDIWLQTALIVLAMVITLSLIRRLVNMR